MKILYIEDAHINIHAMRSIVNFMGYQMQVANNGQDGLQLLRSNPFDLVLLDINLPDMDGFAVLKEMQESDIICPIVAITAHAMVGERERCLQAGFDHYISKPFSFETITNTLKHYAAQMNIC